LSASVSSAGLGGVIPPDLHPNFDPDKQHCGATLSGPASGIRKRESGGKPQMLASGSPLSEDTLFAAGLRYHPNGLNGIAETAEQARGEPK
tara:strand:- start:111 stop:383 length:273 start_codon:yes stop_codon:yes gene_type:complete